MVRGLRFVGCYKPLFTVDVADHFGFIESLLFKQYFYGFSIFFMAFDHEETLPGQVFTGITGDGPVEEQRVLIGYKEGCRRLMFSYLRLQALFFGAGDVRRVGDDAVQGFYRRAPRME